jgi:hypothetical protein
MKSNKQTAIDLLAGKTKMINRVTLLDEEDANIEEDVQINGLS